MERTNEKFVKEARELLGKEMILVIGGLNGFVGSNTTEALVNLGKDCVVTSHKSTEIPGFLQKHITNHRVMVEHADATSIDDLRKIGERHRIDSVVNVGGGFREASSAFPGLKGYMDMLSAIFQAAAEWKVRRVTFSSTGGMYHGLPGTADEEQPIVLPSLSSMVGYQKLVEVAAGEFTRATGIGTLCVRITGMFGPYQDPEGFAPIPRLVRAAVSRTTPNLENTFRASAEDETGLIYIKDLARGIALLHTVDKLQHNVYNITSEKKVTNREFVDMLRKVVPGFNVELSPGKSPSAPSPIMETKRLRSETGFTPKYDTLSAIQDYVDWLTAGNRK